MSVDPIVVILLAATGCAYQAGVVALARRGIGWPPAASLCFGGALLLLLSTWAAGPLADPATFPLHAVAHLLFAMVAPLLLALSAPVLLLLRVARGPARRRLLAFLHSPPVRVATHPVVVLTLEIGGLYGFYLTPLATATEHNAALHLLVHLHMFGAGCLLSWLLVGRDPMPALRGTTVRLVILAVAAAAHDLLAKLLYRNADATELATAAEVRLGAQVLYYGGGAVEMMLAIGICVQWYRREGRQLQRERRRSVAQLCGSNRLAPSCEVSSSIASSSGSRTAARGADGSTSCP